MSAEDTLRAALEALIESCDGWSNDDIRDHCRAALEKSNRIATGGSSNDA